MSMLPWVRAGRTIPINPSMPFFLSLNHLHNHHIVSLSHHIRFYPHHSIILIIVFVVGFIQVIVFAVVDPLPVLG